MGERFGLLCAEPYHPGAPRVVAALARHGADVCVIAPRESYVAHTRFKRADILMPFSEIERKLPAIVRTLAEEFRADAILVGDEPMFSALVVLLQRLDETDLSSASRALLTRSLPPVGIARQLVSDAAFIAARPESACAPPRTLAAPTDAEALAFARDVGFPLVVKVDGHGGGLGVTRCNDEPALRAALANRIPDRGYVVQRFVEGKVCSVVLSGMTGKVAGAFCYAKFITDREHGMSSVITHEDRADIIADAWALYESCGFSGYISIDYIVEDGGRGYLLEINRGISGKSHLTCFGVDLTASLLAMMRGQTPAAAAPKTHDCVACFPIEWARDPASPYLMSALHDVPWDDPDVLAAMIAAMHRQTRGPNVVHSPP